MVTASTTGTKPKRLAILPNGRSVYAGDTVTNTSSMTQHIVAGIHTEDGDRYLQFTDGKESLVAANSPFWRKYAGGAHIHLK